MSYCLLLIVFFFFSLYVTDYVKRTSTQPYCHTWQRHWATPSLKSSTHSPPTVPRPSWPPITYCCTSSTGARKQPKPTRFWLYFHIHTSWYDSTQKKLTVIFFFFWQKLETSDGSLPSKNTWRERNNTDSKTQHQVILWLMFEPLHSLSIIHVLLFITVSFCLLLSYN